MNEDRMHHGINRISSVADKCNLVESNSACAKRENINTIEMSGITPIITTVNKPMKVSSGFVNMPSMSSTSIDCKQLSATKFTVSPAETCSQYTNKIKIVLDFTDSKNNKRLYKAIFLLLLWEKCCEYSEALFKSS